MENNLNHYKFSLTRIIDGDTIVGDIDVGFDLILKDQHIRLLGINTPEIKGETKWAGYDAMSFVDEALNDNPIILKVEERDSFGRVLATVYYEDYDTEEWINLNQALLDNGHAVPYGK